MLAIKPAFKRKTSTDRRQDLIDAGIRCLGEGGISNFTIDKICKQAKVSRGLINHHFESKDDLLLCIYGQMTAYLVETDSGVTAQQHIVALIKKSFDQNSFEKSNLRAWLAIWGEVATHTELRQLHESRYQVYKNNLVHSIDELAHAKSINIDANTVARQLIALIDGLWLEYCLHSNSFSLDVARRDCYRFLRGQLGELDVEAN